MICSHSGAVKGQPPRPCASDQLFSSSACVIAVEGERWLNIPLARRPRLYNARNADRGEEARMSKTIAVLGTGANGSCTAADLTKAGCDVVLIDQWPAHVEAMRANGLRVNMPDRELHVPVRAYHLCDVCTLNQTFDVVLLAMKAYDARWAYRIHQAAPCSRRAARRPAERHDRRADRRSGGTLAHPRLRGRAVIGAVHARCRAAQYAAGEDLVRARQPRSVHGWAAGRDRGAPAQRRKGVDHPERPRRQVDEARRQHDVPRAIRHRRAEHG